MKINCFKTRVSPTNKTDYYQTPHSNLMDFIKLFSIEIVFFGFCNTLCPAPAGLILSSDFCEININSYAHINKRKIFRSDEFCFGVWKVVVLIRQFGLGTPDSSTWPINTYKEFTTKTIAKLHLATSLIMLMIQPNTAKLDGEDKKKQWKNLTKPKNFCFFFQYFNI